MTVGIVGLGLIGGSLARAYAKAGHHVLAQESNKSMLAFAQLAGAVSSSLDQKNISTCDLILLAIYPQADVAIRATGGLCSFYAEKGGMIIGFEK